jgi:hypothetical protein
MPAGIDNIHDVRVELDDLLPAGAGDGVYRLTVTGQREHVTVKSNGYYYMADTTLVSLSDLALSARVGAVQVNIWALSLASATPQTQVKVRLYSQHGQSLGEALTNNDGLAQVSLTTLNADEKPGFIIAERTPPPAGGESRSTLVDMTWLDLQSDQLRDDSVNSGGRAYLRQGHEAFVYTDRGIYRPGETVRLRTLVRGPDGSVPPSIPLRIRVLRPDLHVWRTMVVTLDADGNAEQEIIFPSDVRTGRWTIDCGLPGDGPAFGTTAIQLEDFLPDRLRTTMTLKIPGVSSATPMTEQEQRYFISNGPLTVAMQGDWLFGQPAANQPCELQVRLDPAPFAPKAWSGWSFGDQMGFAESLTGKPVVGHRLSTKKGRLNNLGDAEFTLPANELIADEAIKIPWRLSATVGVSEASGRTTSTTRQLLVDVVDR